LKSWGIQSAVSAILRKEELEDGYRLYGKTEICTKSTSAFPIVKVELMLPMLLVP
jgi:hypothetical protein